MPRRLSGSFTPLEKSTFYSLHVNSINSHLCRLLPSSSLAVVLIIFSLNESLGSSRVRKEAVRGVLYINRERSLHHYLAFPPLSASLLSLLNTPPTWPLLDDGKSNPRRVMTSSARGLVRKIEPKIHKYVYILVFLAQSFFLSSSRNSR